MTTWHWPQWIMLALIVLSVVISITKDGQPKPPYDGKAAIIAGIFQAWLLWYEGFWG